MKPLYHRTLMALASAGLFITSQVAFAQAETPATPEPGDSPVVESVQVVPQTEFEVESAEPTIGPAPETSPETIASEPVPAPFDARRIEQRVDGTQEQEVIRVAPRAKKNVTRVDNLPNRPRVTPVAVIKGPVAPWGYAGRYMSGQVDRPSGRDLQGTPANQPGSRAGATLRSDNTSTSTSRGGGQGARRRED